MSFAISFMARIFFASFVVDAITGVEDRLHHGLCDDICELHSDVLRAALGNRLYLGLPGRTFVRP
jgi:hypothetical protein